MADTLFRSLRTESNSFKVRITWTAVDGPKIIDILANVGNRQVAEGLKLREHKTLGVMAPGAWEIEVSSSSGTIDLMKLIHQTGSDYLQPNVHSFLSFIVEKNVAVVENGISKNVKELSRLSCIVLAEGAVSGDVSGQKPWELMFNEVLMALEKKHPTVPYRRSKITLLLKDNLAGTQFSTFIGIVSSEMERVPKTMATLKMAQRLHKLKPVTKPHGDIFRLGSLINSAILHGDKSPTKFLRKSMRRQMNRHESNSLKSPSVRRGLATLEKAGVGDSKMLNSRLTAAEYSDSLRPYSERSSIKSKPSTQETDFASNIEFGATEAVDLQDLASMDFATENKGPELISPMSNSGSFTPPAVPLPTSIPPGTSQISSSTVKSAYNDFPSPSGNDKEERYFKSVYSTNTSQDKGYDSVNNNNNDDGNKFTASVHTPSSVTSAMMGLSQIEGINLLGSKEQTAQVAARMARRAAGGDEDAKWFTALLDTLERLEKENQKLYMNIRVIYP
eukprot:TRINITY_DN1576_c0_g2_i4.p1 TRINITY_DN1576_c0_g2~~TRINITY_DN1576_c0_g2_i4.p1  ORF type:complete len:572 (-),score=180.91 TRINITY_DN1576_c0_g2_i4:1662-3173(-)